MQESTSKPTEYKTCSKCGESKPATHDHFAYNQKRRLRSICRECARQANRLYYIEHRDSLIRRVNSYRAENPEIVRESQRRSKQKHNAAIKVYRQRWNADNKDRKRLLEQRRKARKRALVATLTAKEWRDILEAHRHTCAYCGKGGMKLTQDHVIPLSQGGGYTRDNIVPACQSCNSRKGAKTPEQAGMPIKVLRDFRE